MTALGIKRKLRLSPKQRRAFAFRAPPKEDGSPQIEIVGILGEYGGGKTYIHMARLITIALENPFEYGVHSGGDEPLTALVSPTMGDLKKSTLVQFLKTCPDELIYQTRLYGEFQDIQLINGHRILCYSAEGAMNGPTLCQLGVDEVQEKVYDGKWTNLQGRVRDKRARRLSVSASGIAQRGHVEEIFRRPNTENRLTVLLFPEDNKSNLAKGYVEELNASLPASRERDADGWLLPQDAMFPRFARVRHLRMPPAMTNLSIDDLKDRATSLAVDFGRSGAVVFGQPIEVPITPLVPNKPRTDQGLLLVDQLMPDNIDAEEMVAFIKTKKADWKIVPGKSVICLDPTAERDQVRHFQRGFPGVRIIQVPRGFYHLEENGVRAIDRALLDLNGDIRLFIHPSMAIDESGRGVVAMFGGYLATKPKDKFYEHASDVVRYLTQYYVPLPDRPSASDPVDVAAAERKARPLAAGLKVSDF